MMTMPASGGPEITDVTFRLSQAGDMIGIDFECSDNRTRSVMLPVASLPKLVAGLLWAGAESAERHPAHPLSMDERERLQDGARAITHWRVAPAPEKDTALLEIESGAAHAVFRVPGTSAMLLGLALQRAAGDIQ